MEYISQEDYNKGVDLINRLGITASTDNSKLPNYQQRDAFRYLINELNHLGIVPTAKIKKVLKFINTTYFAVMDENDIDMPSVWKYAYEEFESYVKLAKKRVIPITLEILDDNISEGVLSIINYLKNIDIPFYMGEHFISIPLALYSKEFIDKDGYYYLFYIDVNKDKFFTSIYLTEDKKGEDIAFETNYIDEKHYKAKTVIEDLKSFIMKIRYNV